MYKATTKQRRAETRNDTHFISQVILAFVSYKIDETKNSPRK